MNAVAILNTQFVQVALPFIIGLILAVWLNGKNFEMMGRHIDEFKYDVLKRLERIEAKLICDKAIPR